MRDYFWGSTEKEEAPEPMTVHDYATESKGHASTDNNVVVMGMT